MKTSAAGQGLQIVLAFAILFGGGYARFVVYPHLTEAQFFLEVWPIWLALVAVAFAFGRIFKD